MVKQELKMHFERKVPLWRSQRLRVIIMCFFGLVCAYSHRSNLSMAMVCMVGKTQVTTSNKDNNNLNLTLVSDNDTTWSSSDNVTRSDEYTPTNNGAAQSHVDNVTKVNVYTATRHGTTRTYIDNVTGANVYSALSKGTTWTSVDNIVGSNGNTASSDNSTWSLVDTTPTNGGTTSSLDNVSSESKPTNTQEFVWSKEEQGILLGSFYWGYLLLQIPSGWLAGRFGAARVVGVFTSSVAILTILTPLCARTSSYLLLTIRIITGACQAALTPCMQSLFSKWIPQRERSRLVSVALAGQNIGTAVTFPVAGILCEYGFDGGWPSIFYVFGVFNILWSLLWILIISNSPSTSPRISQQELAQIENDTTTEEKHGEDRGNTPWLAILTSKPIWGLFIIHICSNYGGYMMLTMLPSYFKDVMDLDIQENGVMSMLPYLAIWFVTNVVGVLGDQIINRKYLSVLWTRKVMSTIGCVAPGAVMFAMGHIEDQTLAVIMLTISGAMTGFQIPGFYANYGEVAPTHAGVVYGISNTLASIPGILAPYVVSSVTKHATRAEWTIAFYISGVIYILGAIAYLVLGDAVAPKWSNTTNKTMTTDKDGISNRGFTSINDEISNSITKQVCTSGSLPPTVEDKDLDTKL